MMGAPLRAVQYVEPYERIPALFSVTVLGERPHGKRIASVLLATVGVVARSWTRAGPATRRPPRAQRAPHPSPPRGLPGTIPATMLIYPPIDPVALQIGPLAIHWYGLSYLAAFGLFML